ncbi:WD40 repeat domain-containing protein [Streptomyces sp. NPDC086081]|uniref:WD40 repeat domain-containing protein n=1 Tax=Streptomyces sp. NPDC086081 TaxID=3365749 RepID=UPI0037F6A34C
MIRHHGPISGVAAFGGAYVATAGYDNQVILWDAARRAPLARAVHDHLANQVAFSPDGKLLLTSSSDYTARLWSVPDLKLRAVLSEQKDDVEMSVFHPTRELVATASRDHLVRVYDFAGALVARFEGHTADVISVAWLGESDELLTSSDDGTVKRWSLASGGMVGEVDLGGVETDTIAITRAGVVYAGNDDGEIITIADGRTGKAPAHEAGIKRLVYNAATESLVSLSYDRTLRVWDASDAEAGLRLTHTAEFPAEVWARSCAFLDDSTLVFGTFGSSYALYRVTDGTWDLTGVEPTACVNSVVTTADGAVWTTGDAGLVWVDGTQRADTGSLCNFLVEVGDRVLTGGQLGRVFDARDGRVLHQHRSPLNCAAAFTRDGVPHVVVGAYTGEGLVFAVREGQEPEHVATLPLHTNAVKGVAVSGDTLFAVCADASVSWFSLETFTETGRVDEAHARIANGCAPLPGGRFASVSRDLTLRIWDDRTSRTVPTPHDHSVKCVAASPDGRLVATGSYAGTVAVHDVTTGEWPVVVRPTTAGISSLHWDATRGRFLASSYDGRVYPLDPPETAQAPAERAA